ncbi:MAG: helix-turn-helix domain-containing protein [Anaerolineales bacterium]
MSDSVGTRLRQARELRHLTIQEVSETTRVRPHYLEALENDDHSAIPSAAQARGFLRIYAAFLELNLSELIPAAPRPDSFPPVDAIPSAEAGSEAAPSSNLWTGLRARLSRRSKKDALVSPSAPSQAAKTPPVPPAPLPASTEVPTKTSFRPKVTLAQAGLDETGAPIDDLKKNIEG